MFLQTKLIDCKNCIGFRGNKSGKCPYIVIKINYTILR